MKHICPACLRNSRKVRDLLSNIDQTDFAGLSPAELNDAGTTFKRLRTDVDRIAGLFSSNPKPNL